MNLHTDIVTSVVRSVEPDRSQQVNHRVAGHAQDQIAAQASVQFQEKKVKASDKADKAKIKKDSDKQKESEDQGQHGCHGQSYSSQGQTETIGEDPEGHVIDALA